MYRALLWKEWREQRWKLAMGAMLIVALMGGLLYSRVLPSHLVTLSILGVASVILPILGTIDVLVAERKNGTFDYLVGLPLSPQRLCLIKCLVGYVTVLLPMLAGIAAAGLVGLLHPKDQIAPWFYIPNVAERGFPSGWSIVALLGAATMWYVVAYGISTDRPHEGEVFVSYLEITVIAALGFAAFGTAQTMDNVDNVALFARAGSFVAGMLDPAVAYLALVQDWWGSKTTLTPTLWWPLYVIGQLALAAAMLYLGTRRFVRKL